LSRSQDIEAGDGTTSVVVIAGSLLEAAEKLLTRGIHPSAISDAFQRASTKCVEILTKMSRPIEMNDRESLIQSASTSLNSKVVSQHSSQLAPLAVDAVLKVIDPTRESNVDLKVFLFLLTIQFGSNSSLPQDIKVICQLGGTVDDTELVEGLVFTQRPAGANPPRKVEKAKIGLIQFCISPPKTDASFL
jgi:T-complex protein 1 subunit delta